MLFQFPILIAMFRFFPASIELRQKSFLWADDLSSYDSIMTLPWDIPFYGDHVSLFTLLMTVSTVMYTKMNSQSMGGQMEQMKWIMYLMPVMFLGFFNNYAAALSYYYFLANMFTFSQQYFMDAGQNLLDDPIDYEAEARKSADGIPRVDGREVGTYGMNTIVRLVDSSAKPGMTYLTCNIYAST